MFPHWGRTFCRKSTFFAEGKKGEIPIEKKKVLFCYVHFSAMSCFDILLLGTK